MVLITLMRNNSLIIDIKVTSLKLTFMLLSFVSIHFMNE